MCADQDDAAGPTHVRGMPNPDRLGFVFLPAHGVGPVDFSESAGAVAARLGRPVSFRDAEGFDDEIVAGAIDAAGDRMAWLQCRSRDDGGHVQISFRFRAAAGGRDHVDWAPRCYNPYFGVNPLQLGWAGDTLVFVYSEKHHVYRAEFDAAGRLTLTRFFDGRFVPPEVAEQEWAARFAARRGARGFQRTPLHTRRFEVPHEPLVALAIAILFAAAIVFVYIMLPRWL